MKNFPLCVSLFAVVLVLTFSLGLRATDFENGDFVKGKFRWEGDGHVGFVDKDGTIEPGDASNDVTDSYDTADTADKNPILEMKLGRMVFKRVWQKFNVPQDTKSLEVTVTYKGSPGFQRNNKALCYTSGTSSEPGSSSWSYDDVLYPKVDMFVRFDKNDDYSECYYKLGGVKPGVEWQTLKADFSRLTDKSQVTINLFAAPGDGSLYIKSVKVKVVK